MSETVDAVVLYDSHGDSDAALRFTRERSVPSAVKSMAEMVTGNRLWRELPGAALVARAVPHPLIVSFGSFSAFQRRVLADLADQFREVIAHHVYIGYSEAELAAGRLAAALSSRLGAEELRRYRFAAMPRGGLIVLGMLAYVLGLSHDRIVGLSDGTPDDDAGPLVVVDDCALSGVRFRQFLSRTRARSVVFAPLFAAAELCREVERQEARVVACVTGTVLRDRAPQELGEAYPQWRSERRRLIGDHGYWAGRPEHIAFAWSEPETNFWNSETDRFEASWNVVPPRLCLDRRTRLAETTGPYTILPELRGPVRPADRVLWAEIDSSIAVARLPDEPSGGSPCFRLDGTAAAFWLAIVASGSVDEAANRLRAEFDVEPHVLRRDVSGFVSELEDAGLLVSDGPTR